MNIRIYTSQDKNACIAIFDSNCPRYFLDHERAEFIDWLEKEDRLEYYVLEIDDEILACGGIYKDDDLDQVGFAWGMVSRSHHGKGLGSALAKHRIKILDDKFPSYDCKLSTSQLTDAFFAKHGFVQTAYEKDGWGKGMDKVTMFRRRSKPESH